MRDVVICEPLRTAVGRFGGVFKDVPVQTLAATVISALVERTGIDGFAITTNIDLGVAGPHPLDQARTLRSWTRLPVAVSGGFDTGCGPLGREMKLLPQAIQATSGDGAKRGGAARLTAGMQASMSDDAVIHLRRHARVFINWTQPMLRG